MILPQAAFVLFCAAPLIAAGGQAPAARPAPVVCVDPGHPSEVNSGKTVQNGTTEMHIDWVVANKLKRLLEGDGCKVVMTRDVEDLMVTNRERAEIGNRAGAVLTIRLHCDAGSSSGYALYYPDRQGTAHGKTGPGATVMQRSRSAAETIEKSMAQRLRGLLNSGGVRGDSKTLIGSKQGALTGSIFSTIPIVTVEMVVLSNANDAAFIKSTKGQDALAQAIAAGVDAFVKASSTKDKK